MALYISRKLGAIAPTFAVGDSLLTRIFQFVVAIAGTLVFALVPARSIPGTIRMNISRLDWMYVQTFLLYASAHACRLSEAI